jgi:hypothetical protein
MYSVCTSNVLMTTDYFIVKASVLCRSDHISPTDDLAFDMYLDPDVAQVIRRLEHKKQDAVARRCFARVFNTLVFTYSFRFVELTIGYLLS